MVVFCPSPQVPRRFDLLTDVGVAEQSGDLSIVEDSRGNIQACGKGGGVSHGKRHVFCGSFLCPPKLTDPAGLHTFMQTTYITNYNYNYMFQL